MAWDQPEPVVCAHYVASSRDGSGPKMRFATPNPFASGCSDVWRISDGGARGLDKFAFGQTCPPNALAQAKSWVNLGAVGAGFGAGWGSFAMVSGYTITP